MDSPDRLQFSAQQVADYLRRHPEFLRDHPDLLRDLSIPHATAPGVSSLIERQVGMLRGRSTELQQELDARRTREAAQRTLTQGVLSAALKVQRARSAESAAGVLARCLRQEYAADELRVYIFRDGDVPTGAQAEGIRHLPRTAKLKYLFIELLNRNRPLCGSLQDEHIRLLFQAADDHVASTLVVPLRQADWEGLVAVGSREHGRYGRGLELDLAAHLVSVFGARLDELMRTVTA